MRVRPGRLQLNILKVIRLGEPRDPVRRDSRGEEQPRDFLASLPEADRAAILADIVGVAEQGRKAPVSAKAITGARGLMEIRTHGFRTFFATRAGATLRVLHACRKQDQWHGIEVARARMRILEGWR